MPAFKCEYCGKFRSAKDTLCYVPYRHDGILEPADAQYVCTGCYDKHKSAIDGNAWIKPYRLGAETEGTE